MSDSEKNCVFSLYFASKEPDFFPISLNFGCFFTEFQFSIDVKLRKWTRGENKVDNPNLSCV